MWLLLALRVHGDRSSTSPCLPRCPPVQVLVMEQGELMEYDAPATLLANRSTMFSKLVDKTGAAAAAALRKMADDHFANTRGRH